MKKFFAWLGICAIFAVPVYLAVGAILEFFNHPQHAFATAQKSVCPIPYDHTPPAFTLRATPGADRTDRQDPNNGALVWSCAGHLYRWHTAVSPTTQADVGHFEPYLVSKPWCRFDDNTGYIEYHVEPRQGACDLAGTLRFKTRPDVDGRASWFDPKLSMWLSTQEDDPSTLLGDTFCKEDPWRSINLSSKADSPFFSQDSLTCLQIHDELAGLRQPASFHDVKREVLDLWAPQFHPGWYAMSHPDSAPTCLDVYQRNDCATMSDQKPGT
jgi:hypothetical protein